MVQMRATEVPPASQDENVGTSGTLCGNVWRACHKRRPLQPVSSLLPLPIQEFVEEPLLFLNIAPWWGARFFRSVARTRLAGRIRLAHRRDFARGGGAGLLAANLRAWFRSWWQYLLLGHKT